MATISDEHDDQDRLERYKIALICAIEFEMSAVRYMLDQEHRGYKHQDDPMTYILGELSGHNVILACLPGNQGKGAAASAATNVARTFPWIKWRFMIGIGGGVPSERHDIRLGDVVISMPQGEHGGVVQYDLGRLTKNAFERKGFLCPPPADLRSAVVIMKSNHVGQDNKIDELVSAMTQKSTRLKTYRRPSPASDILFKADYHHTPGQSTCARCDPDKAVERQDRESNLPEVHYGLIASGDSVVKSAMKRDKFVQALGDVLCFEMEAAGIATEYSCIVIRGISDYADSHKNDAWQKYAAATAAACAKELLSCLDPSRSRAGAAPPKLSRGLLLSDPGPSSGGWLGTLPTFGASGIQQGGLGNNFSVGGDFNMTAVHGNQPLGEATPYKPFSTVPFSRDKHFVDRPEISGWLQKQYERPGGRCALVGPGGIGKSQLAIQFAYQIQDQMPSIYVFWVHASTQARFKEGYREIAVRLKLARLDVPQTDLLRLVYDWLKDEHNGRWLMILDSADDVNVFYPKPSKQGTTDSSTHQPLAAFLPQNANCRIHVTSRNSDVAERLTGHYKILRVPFMDKVQAKKLLRTKLGEENNQIGASDLVDALECMPLAITQAAAYILRRKPRLSVSAYWKEFKKSNKRKAHLLRVDGGDLRRYPDAANSVVTTWQITFDQIQQERPSAADLLSFMSFFNPLGIPDWLLQNYVCRRHTDDKAGINNFKEGEPDRIDDMHAEFEDDLEILRAYSMVSKTTQPHICEMHTLVQLCARDWLLDEEPAWKSIFLRNISLDYPLGSFENWSKCRQLEPHIILLLEENPAKEDAEIWTRLLNKVASYRMEMGDYFMAENISRDVVNNMEKILGKKNPEIVKSVLVLAILLYLQENYEESELMIERASDLILEMYEVSYFPGSENLEKSATKLGRPARYAAKNINPQLLTNDELDSTVQFILFIIYHLSQSLGYQGTNTTTEKLKRLCIDTLEKLLGEEHCDRLVYL